MKKNWSKFHLTSKIGIIMLIVGLCPILVLFGLDFLGIIDAGNALGPGILAFLTFYPAIILIVIGNILTNRKREKIKSSQH